MYIQDRYYFWKGLGKMKKSVIYKGLSSCLVLMMLLSGCGNVAQKESEPKEEQKQVTEKKEEKESDSKKEEEQKEDENETTNYECSHDVRTGASYEYLDGEVDLKIEDGHLLVQRNDFNVAYPWNGLQLDEHLYIPLENEKELEGNLQIEFVEKENGTASFKWNEVENASEYIVFKIEYLKEQGESDEYIYNMLGRTSELSWSYLADSKNGQFCTYEVSVDKWTNDSTKELYAEHFVSEEEPYIRYEHLYGVVAMMEDGSFVKSNYIRSTDISSKLPNTFSSNGEKIIDGSLLDDESELPKTVKVIMANGREEVREVIYDFDNAEEKVDNFIGSTDEDGEIPGIEAVKSKEIPYQVEGTMLEGHIFVRTE